MRVLATLVALATWLSAAPAAAQSVRLAAPADCLADSACGAGFVSAYGLDANPSFLPLVVPDSGVSALDDGLAEIAATELSDPDLARPDVVTLRDDRRMAPRRRVVPVVRLARLSGAGGRDLRRRLDRASATLTTAALRGLNRAVRDGRMPEAVGGEFVAASGLAGGPRRRGQPRVVVGYQATPENETLAHLYGEMLRSGGYRVTLRGVADPAAELAAGGIDLIPSEEGASFGAQPLRLAPAVTGTVFVTTAATAARLSLSALSDLGRYWQAAAG